jgi:16S rRNA C1402 (ribose-2'-O) methylase RsmI
LGELVEHFTATPPRGEIVLVVAGCPHEATVKVDKYARFKQKKVNSDNSNKTYNDEKD